MPIGNTQDDEHPLLDCGRPRVTSATGDILMGAVFATLLHHSFGAALERATRRFAGNPETLPQVTIAVGAALKAGAKVALIRLILRDCGLEIAGDARAFTIKRIDDDG